MTDEETDAGAGRLARRYAETKKKITCIRGLVQETEPAAFKAAHSLRSVHVGDYESIKAGFDAVDWEGISKNLTSLVELGRKKAEIEDCLRDTGLGDLIR